MLVITTDLLSMGIGRGGVEPVLVLESGNHWRKLTHQLMPANSEEALLGAIGK